MLMQVESSPCEQGILCILLLHQSMQMSQWLTDLCMYEQDGQHHTIAQLYVISC